MADVPTAEKVARAILQVFKERNRRVGESVIREQLQSAVAPPDGPYAVADFDEGLQYAEREGWVKTQGTQVHLNPRGKNAMRQAGGT
jgi:hypothetical protein